MCVTIRNLNATSCLLCSRGRAQLGICKGDEPLAGSKVELILSGSRYDATVLSPEDEWIAKLDHVAFRAAVQKIGKDLAEQQALRDAHTHDAHASNCRAERSASNRLPCWQ